MGRSREKEGGRETRFEIGDLKVGDLGIRERDALWKVRGKSGDEKIGV